MLDEFSQPLYIDSIKDTRSHKSEDNEVHLDVDPQPHVIGVIPTPKRELLPLPTIEAIESFKRHNLISFSNILWTILIGWWVALTFVIISVLFFITIVGYKQGLFCLNLALYILYPYGKCAYKINCSSDPLFFKIMWIVISPLFLAPCVIGIFISWEVVFYIPMAKFLFQVIKLCFSDPSSIRFGSTSESSSYQGYMPILLVPSSGSTIYFKFTVFGFGVFYINLTPTILLALLCGFLDIKGTIFHNDLFGAFMGMLGAVPCAYIIGICVDELSHQLGLIKGTIINASFLTIVELILYYFSLKQGLADIVRSAVTGAFLMNLLIIPGCSMLAAGIKWNEVAMNKRAQSISGTFLLLSIMSVIFPSVFYHIHAQTDQTCQLCNMNITNVINDNFTLNCEMCLRKSGEITDDFIFAEYAEPLMIAMTVVMPIIYIVGVFFSVKTHAHIYEYEKQGEGEDESAALSKLAAIIILLVATILFSLMAHVMTEKIPNAIETLHLSQRFVGLVFYTLIPNVAEYMNAIKFALNGNIGLSMEIGNQAAILTALIELPATVLLSYIVHASSGQQLFTLIFPLIDVVCVIIAVFMRNSILSDESINYFTGIAFLTVFLFIAIVYYFDIFN